MVLDAGAAGPRGRAVDHVELAVVGPPELVLAGVDAAVGEQAVAVGRHQVVDHDLRPRLREPREHLARLLVRLGSEGVDDRADLDALGELALGQLGHPHPDLALAPAEHQDVDRRARALDVGVELRGGRPRELERRVSRAPVERARGLLRAVRGDRVLRRRPAAVPLDAEVPPVHGGEGEHGSEQRELHDGWRCRDACRPTPTRSSTRCSRRPSSRRSGGG
jgi:hypothetical protein